MASRHYVISRSHLPELKSRSWSKMSCAVSIGITSLVLLNGLFADELINEAKNFSKEDIDKVLATGSGTSGPGHAVPADGNGFRIGEIAEGVKITAENRSHLASGSSVRDGLLPPIKPIWDVHMR